MAILEEPERLYLLQNPETGWYTQLSLYKDKMPLYNLMNVHPIQHCEIRNCAIHNNPSLHQLTEEPLVWDEEWAAVQRECSHGMVHPDMDDLGYRKTVGQYHVFLAHECDGCCGLEQP